jgi:hypothetical protein
MSDRFRAQDALWPEQTIVVVGGGPSVGVVDLTPLRLSGAPVIAANNAFRLVPWAKVIFFADSRWWRWNGQDIDLDEARYRMVTTGAALRDEGRIQRMRREYDLALATEPNALAGFDSGSMAINLAYHYGASRILLLGFDMRFDAGRAHWHEDHPIVTPESHYVEQFAPRYPALIAALAEQGVEVLRCTPSALTFIPEMPLAQALSLPCTTRMENLHWAEEARLEKLRRI